MDADEALARLRARGFSEDDAQRLFAHFSDAEARGKLGHGYSRIVWLETLEVDPSATPETVEAEGAFERWHGRGALGYLVLDAVVRTQLADPPERARLIVCEETFPTGMLGHYVRRLAAGGLVALLTATSPARLGPPGGSKVAGTNPLAIGIPSSEGEPVVVDVSMGAVTHGDVLAGLATPEQLVPFGGEQWHKALALALGLQLLVDALRRGDGYGAVLLVARPESDPVPALRAAGIRLPGRS
ncbi:MAG: Ldh family oxidoreductase [Acidobacteriota bacterium]|nr:Ldh family oxidoreductase [Acidobacteriota bacterium]MDE3191994.1 Ldh family oxidoreductase [Acidobacteriota bacterium]